MRVTLNKKAFEFAKQLIHEHKFSDNRGRADESMQNQHPRKKKHF